MYPQNMFYTLGWLSVPNLMNFWKISKQPSNPPPLFGKICCNFYGNSWQTGCTSTKFATKFFRSEMTPPLRKFSKNSSIFETTAFLTCKLCFCCDPHRQEHCPLDSIWSAEAFCHLQGLAGPNHPTFPHYLLAGLCRWPMLSDDKGSLWHVCMQHTFWDNFRQGQNPTCCQWSWYIPSTKEEFPKQEEHSEIGQWEPVHLQSQPGKVFDFSEAWIKE